MFAAVVAALTIASAAPTALDVPYVPQTDALCGGAAAAMVFRYWGDAHAVAQSFAPLIDRRAGGIVDTTLVDAIERRGWSVARFAGSLDALDARLAAREPVIVLIGERRNRYHYVVVVGHRGGHVVVHDPSWGPNRAMRDDEFDARWGSSGRWALVVLPGRAPGQTESEAAPLAANETQSPAAERADACGPQMERAMDEVRARGLASADQVFGAVRTACPASAAPLRELAGVRFAQRRWRDAASLAREALARDPNDAYALDVLGSSVFMLQDPVGALRAWNQIGRPTLDAVRISGLRHTRYQTINEALALTPGTLLTADAFERARRRLADLPDRVSARLDIRPDADGYAAVDVVVAERATVPRSASDWIPTGVEAAVDRQVTATLPGFTGQGETWTASWRWWTNRPGAALTFAAPRVAGLPGIWRLDASWQAETYSFADAALDVREARTHAGVSVGDWISAGLRYTVRGGLDTWGGGRRSAFAGATLEQRLRHDRLTIRADVDAWLADSTMPGFGSTTLRAQWASPLAASGWGTAAVAGVQHVGAAAPLALWPGAGDGRARGELLRAHPMLDDGVINVTESTAFGRTLAFANAEAQRWIETGWPVHAGVATFVDVARASERAVAGATTQVDVGAGLRLRLPGGSHALRVDVAHGLRDGANALTVGWSY